tara:strand:+ start:351 stop:947 length:597 start_codon:yes stop_codon:yes gene_type:complete
MADLISGLETIETGEGTSIAVHNNNIVDLDTTLLGHRDVTYGETIAAFDAVYRKDSDGKWYKAKAGVDWAMGIALEAGVVDDEKRVVMFGRVYNTAWAWTTGDWVALSAATAGALVAVTLGPGEDVDNLQVLAFAEDADTLLLIPQFMANVHNGFLGVLTAEPSAPANEQWWIRTDTTTPELRVQAGGSTYKIALVAA